DVAGQGRAPGRGKARCVPDLTRADLTEAQMRRQVGGAIPVGPVAFAGIAGHTVFEEGREPGLRRCLAGIPGVAQARGPVRRYGFEVPAFQRVACRAREAVSADRQAFAPAARTA